jgi:uncharacterized membrane protein YdjX (TVP38/TMEM64 family)
MIETPEMQARAPDAGAAPRLSLRRAAPLIAIAAGAVLGYAAFGDMLSFETLRANRDALLAWRDQNYLLAAGAYLALYVAIVAFSLPGGFVMTVTGGFLFGLVPGAPLAIVAATIGATCIFLAARAGLGDALYARIRAGGRGLLARVERGLAANQVSYLLLMRLVPAIPFVIANLAPAFFGVRLRVFVLTTLFGILPGTLITTWIGVGIGEVFDQGGTPDFSGLLFEPYILIPSLGLCALAALPILLKGLSRLRAG